MLISNHFGSNLIINLEGETMTKKDFIKNYVQPYTKPQDKPFNRALFNDAKDMLHKDGRITDWQVQNWIYQNTKLYI